MREALAVEELVEKVLVAFIYGIVALFFLYVKNKTVLENSWGFHEI